MAAPQPEQKDDASYPYLLPLESSDDEEIHTAVVALKKPKLHLDKGETSNSELSLKFDEWLMKDGNFDCAICFSDLPESEKFPMNGCIHQFCNGCISMYITTRVEENDIPIKCPMLDCKFSFLQLEMCQDIVTQEIIDKKDSTVGSQRHNEQGSQDFNGISKDHDQLLLNLADRNRWKNCPKCNICIEKVDGCRVIRCRCGCRFCYACGRQVEDCPGSCPF